MGATDNTARVFELATRREVWRLKFQDLVLAVAFSPDGRYLVAGSEDKTARVFEAGSGKELSRVTFQRSVDVATLSADGRYVATGSYDHTARVFEAASGKELSRLGFYSPVRAVAFSPDAHRLLTLTLSNDRREAVLARHLLRPQDLIDEACSRLTRNLTDAEWKHFIPGGKYHQTCPNLPPGAQN